jgi:hypothetical protein
MSRACLTALFLLAALARPALAQGPLPPVDGVEWRPFRAHCLALLEALDAAKAPLPPETAKAVRALLKAETGDAAAVQKLLDAHCLVDAHINPESRVKAVRGPARPVLVLDRPAVVLVRVHNEGGVTHPVAVAGPGLLRPGTKGADRWLEAAVLAPAPLAPRLSGKRLEYRLLRLTPRQAGKREATLRFDVGQGTQDLGFRAEVPILFTVRAR